MTSLDLPPITELYTDMITTEKIGQRTMDDWISYQDYQQLVEEEPTYERVAVMQSVEVNTHLAAIKKELEQILCMKMFMDKDIVKALEALQAQIGKTTEGGK